MSLFAAGELRGQVRLGGFWATRRGQNPLAPSNAAESHQVKRPTATDEQAGEQASGALKAEGPHRGPQGIRRSGIYFMAGGRLSERRSHPLVAFAV
jgi:hypothetical protein